ncbi:hypothetical protein D3C85_1361080 [compost metagenome]
MHRDHAAAQRGQLLDAEHQHAFVLAGQQGMTRQMHRRGAAGAGVFNVVDRNAFEAQIAQDHLAKDHPAQYVGTVHGLNIRQLQTGVGHRIENRPLRQFRCHHARVTAEDGHRAAHYMHLSHGRVSRDWNRKP